VTEETVAILGLSDHLVTRESTQRALSHPLLKSETDPARKIIDFNRDELSQILGYQWHNTSPIEWSRISRSDNSNLQELATLLVQELAQEGGSILIEDASMGCLLPFWSELFRKAGFTIKAVCMTRGCPFETSALIQRNGLTSGHSVLTWTNYWLTTITNLQLTNQVYVDLDLLSDNTENERSRIEKALRINRSSWLAHRLEQWIKMSILRYARDIEDSEKPKIKTHLSELPRVTRDLYGEIAGLCRGNDAVPQKNKIDRLIQQHKANACILRSHDINFNELLEHRRKIQILDASVKGYQQHLDDLSMQIAENNLALTSMLESRQQMGRETQGCIDDESGKIATVSSGKSVKPRKVKEVGGSISPDITSGNLSGEYRTVSSELACQQMHGWQPFHGRNNIIKANDTLSQDYEDLARMDLVLPPTVLLSSSSFNSDVIQSCAKDDAVYIYSGGHDPSIVLPRIMHLEGRVDLEVDIELPGERLVQLYYLETWFQDFREQYSFATSLPIGRHQICWKMPLAFSGVIRLDPGNGTGLYKLYSIRAVIHPL